MILPIIIISLCILSLVFILVSVFYAPLGMFVFFHEDWKFWHNILKNKNKISLIEEINSDEEDIFIFELEDIYLKYNFTRKKVHIMCEDMLIPKYINNKLTKILDSYLFGNYHY